MQISFLQAFTSLTKSFSQTTKTSYPNALDFTSHSYEVQTIEDFYAHLTSHAAQGHCLLKGSLTKPLNNEPRAKSTDPQSPTSWVCFDFDGLDPQTNLQGLLDSFPGFQDTDFIVQYSASYGVQGQSNLLKAHVFVLLANEVAPTQLKQFLTQLNIDNQTLNSSLRLTKTANSLSYPLDPTVALNHSLIYIAPPVCTPPALDTLSPSKRIQLIKRAKLAANMDFSSLKPTETLKTQLETRINELRSSQNLPPRKKFNYLTDSKSGISYLAKPDNCVVTGVKTDRGFVYLNLNGGDSWGYYYPEDNPTFLYNFKDEPAYKLSEIAPDYYPQAKAHANKIKSGQIQQIQPSQVAASPSSPTNSTQAPRNRIYLVFRDMQTAIYYNGIYDPGTQSWDLARAGSEKMLADFMVQHGQPAPEVIPIWDLVFDPHSPPIDVQNRKVNLYKEPDLLVQAKALPTPVTTMPPTIHKVIWSVVGNDQDTFDHFVNWLAFIVQTKERTQTAWLFNGVQGTGKGLLAHKVLRPLLGYDNTAFLEAVQLEDKFNEAFERSVLTVIDEMTIGDLEGSSKILGTMKSLITEPVITIRKMRSAPYSVPNYNNWIAFANTREQVRVEASDRRYNVGVYQNHKLNITDAEISTAIPAELVDFASYMLSYNVAQDKVRKPLDNKARQDMQDLSLNSIDKISDAIETGDLEELFSQIVELNFAQGKTMNTAPAYKDLMYNVFLHDYTALSREELQIIFSHCIGDVPSSPAKFSRFLAHHNIKVSPVSRDHKVFRGIKVTWRYDKAWYNATKAMIIAEKTPKLNIVKKETNA